MNAARWGRLRPVLEGALDRPPVERKAFLREVCSDDETLLLEVEALVEAEEAAGSLLEAPAASWAPGLVARVGSSSGFAPQVAMRAPRCWVSPSAGVSAGGCAQGVLARPVPVVRPVVERKSSNCSDGGAGRRRRAGRVAAVLAIAGLVVSTAGMAWQASQARAARDLVQRQQAVAEQVTDFLSGVFRSTALERERGEEVTGKQLLDRSVQRINVELSEQPLLKADLLVAMADAYSGLALFDRAATLLDEVMVLREENLPVGAPEILATRTELGKLMLKKGDYPTASVHLDAAVAGLRPGGDSPQLAHALTYRSYLSGILGQGQRTIDLRQESLALRRRLWGDQHAEVAQGWNDLGFAYWEGGDFAAADEALQQAVALRKSLFGGVHPDLAVSVKNRGEVLRDLGQLKEAERVGREALDIGRQVWDENHPMLAKTVLSLGATLLELNELEKAQSLIDEALAMNAELHPEGHPRSLPMLIHRARVELARGRPAAALEWLGEAEEVQSQFFPTDHRDAAWLRGVVSAAKKELERFDQADGLLRPAEAGPVAARRFASQKTGASAVDPFAI